MLRDRKLRKQIEQILHNFGDDIARSEYSDVSFEINVNLLEALFNSNLKEQREKMIKELEETMNKMYDDKDYWDLGHSLEPQLMVGAFTRDLIEKLATNTLEVKV